MANAGGAWDNAKKIVEVELKEKGTPLHAATVVGDTVGDPFKDTSSVAMNPVIKFTTLFGLLAVELAVEMTAAGQGTADPHPRRRLLRRLAVLRLAQLLRHADRHEVGVDARGSETHQKGHGPLGRVPLRFSSLYVYWAKARKRIGEKLR